MKKERYGELKRVTGKWLKDTYKWFVDHEDQGGCAHIGFMNTANHEVCVCVGWTKIDVDDGPGEPVKVRNCTMYTHKSHEEWRVAWKIGWQKFDNGMQTDLDIDFDMPWNTKAYCDKMNAKLTKEEKRRGTKYREGDVYDTEETIELKNGGTTPVGYRDWNALAAFIRKTARKVAAYAKDVDPEDSDD